MENSEVQEDNNNGDPGTVGFPVSVPMANTSPGDATEHRRTSFRSVGALVMLGQQSR